MAPSSSLPYAGDVSATEAWKRLAADPKVQLVDVRTLAEWNFVGVPDLSSVGRQVHCIEWQDFPHGAPNPDFVAQASQALNDKDAPVLLLCRSGARSRAAAIASWSRSNGWKRPRNYRRVRLRRQSRHRKPAI